MVLLSSPLPPASNAAAVSAQPQSATTTVSTDPKTTMVHPNHLPYARFYPPDWPTVPFHQGEITLQRHAGVHNRVMSYASKVIRPYMPEQHREFYTAQPFLVAAARDTQGNLWATLLMNEQADPSWIASPNPRTLQWQAEPVATDALHGAMQPGTDVGLLGIEFATKRRNRVNGRIIGSPSTRYDPGDFTVFSVDQSFGNCPQYIKPRQWWTTNTTSRSTRNNTHNDLNRRSSPSSVWQAHRPSKLTKAQIKFIGQSETIFTATGYRGPGHDVRYGNDASHRGGPAGFLRVVNDSTLLLPEFAGNNHFNSLGNLLLDARMGITIPDFANGGMLQLTGHAEVDMDTERAASTYPGALRLVIFHIEQVNQVPSGSLPVRWSPLEDAEQRQLVVSAIVQESSDVKSFHLQALPNELRSLWNFQAGQHLPLQLRTPRGELLRNYSLSGPASDAPTEYRISVKHEPMGQASSFLHHHVKVGDVLDVSRPSGDFVFAQNSKRTAVFLSSGVGVTPLLAMLHEFAKENNDTASAHPREAVWIHGARDSAHHPFRCEIKEIQARLPKQKRLTTCVTYSQLLPTDNDMPQGRINLALIKRLVPDLSSADFYLCGSGGFMADMEQALQNAGVDPSHVRSESF